MGTTPINEPSETISRGQQHHKEVFKRVLMTKRKLAHVENSERRLGQHRPISAHFSDRICFETLRGSRSGISQEATSAMKLGSHAATP
jgi:hypothetical protein